MVCTFSRASESLLASSASNSVLNRVGMLNAISGGTNADVKSTLRSDRGNRRQAIKTNAGSAIAETWFDSESFVIEKQLCFSYSLHGLNNKEPF